MPRYVVSNLISNDNVSFRTSNEQEQELARLGISYRRSTDWNETIIHLYMEANDPCEVRTRVFENRKEIEQTLDIRIIPGLFKVEEEVDVASLDRHVGSAGWD